MQSSCNFSLQQNKWESDRTWAEAISLPLILPSLMRYMCLAKTVCVTRTRARLSSRHRAVVMSGAEERVTGARARGWRSPPRPRLRPLTASCTLPPPPHEYISMYVCTRTDPMLMWLAVWPYPVNPDPVQSSSINECNSAHDTHCVTPSIDYYFSAFFLMILHMYIAL